MTPLIREMAKEAADLGYDNLLFSTGDGHSVSLMKEDIDGIGVSIRLEAVNGSVHATLMHLPRNTMMLQISTPSFSFPHRSFGVFEEAVFRAARAYALAQHEAQLMQRQQGKRAPKRQG